MVNKQRKWRGEKNKTVCTFSQAGRALSHTAKPSQRPVRLLVLFTAFSQVRGVTRRASHELTSSSLSPFISPTHYPTTLLTSHRGEQYGLTVGDWTDRAWCLGGRCGLLSPLIFSENHWVAISELLVIALLASCLCWLAGKRSSFEWLSDLLLDMWCRAFAWHVLPWSQSSSWRCLSINLRFEADTIPYFAG